MAMFDVYVEGATDPSPQATERLAEVMSQRYGLAAGDLVNRLTKGRFRVKANIDEATARTYARDLEAVGARVTVAESRSTSTLPPPRPGVEKSDAEKARAKRESKGSYSITRPSAPSVPPPAAARNASASLPPSNAARPASPSLPPAGRPPPSSSLPPRTQGPSTPPTGSPYASGLSAAFHEDTPVPELGALDKDAFEVGALDGSSDLKIEASPSSLPASIGPPPKPAAPKVERPQDVPMDLFAPPDAQGEEHRMELAVDEAPRRESRQRLATPANAVPVVVGPSPSSPVLRPRANPDRSAGVRMASVGEEEAPRWRFAAGVLASVVLGFIPANCVQSAREDSAFHAIDTHVATVQVQAATSSAAPVPFAQLDAFREEQLDRKKRERRNIAIVSLLIWAVAGAGVGYLWFRRVPWDKIKFGQS
jgi:hypothetical protein